MTKTVEEHDVVIIGGGPAGLAASIWCTDLGLDSFLIERNSEVGGQLLWIHNAIKNYPGVETENGRELRDRIVRHMPGHARSVGDDVVSTDLKSRTLTLASGRLLRGRALVIATGIRRDRLGIDGELEFAGKGILDSGAGSRDKVGGKRIVIVGGGDAAAENALILSEAAAHVLLIHRGPELSCRESFRREIAARENVELLFSTRLTRIEGKDSVGSVIVSTADGTAERTIPCDHVLIRIGVSPNTEIFAGQIELDRKGYIVTGKDGPSSVPGVYAVGDVAWPEAPTIPTAVGTAAAAVKCIAAKLKTN